MTRVLLVVKGLDIGGVERIVVELAQELDDDVVRVEVAVLNGRRDAFVASLRGSGIEVHALGNSDRVGVVAALRLRRLVKEAHFDVVHAHGPIAAVLARAVAGDVPVVSTSHTPFTSLHPLTRAAWTLGARRDAARLAVSSAVAASLPRRVRDVVEVMPHGVDTVAAERARAHRAEAAGPPVRAITVARHRGVKNYPNLLRAVQAARAAGAPLELVAVGEGPDLEHHRALAAELGLGDVVHFVAPRLDVLTLIAASDFLVVASDHEGQPLVVEEALSVGCPVVSTAVGRVPELVGPEVGRVVPPGRADLLGAAMAELALDPQLRGRLAAAALARPAVWTLAEVVDAHRRLYLSLGGPK